MTKRRHKKYVKWIIIALVFIAVVSFIVIFTKGTLLHNNNTEAGLASYEDEQNDDGVLEVHFFDVGEADSALVSFGDHHMLIDGGYPSESSFLYSYLKNHQIDHLDYIVCSHAHEDHVGGLAGALNAVTVGTAFAPVEEAEGRSFEGFVKYLKKQGKTITVPKPGDKVYLGDARVMFLGPVDMSLAEEDLNNSSIILQVKYKKTSILFTGDAGMPEEASVVASGMNLRSTVLKVGHHGSSTSSSETFLRRVRPKYCVISVGKDNPYGHPHEETISRLEQFTKEIYRTDRDGEIVCICDGRDVRIE